MANVWGAKGYGIPGWKSGGAHGTFDGYELGEKISGMIQHNASEIVGEVTQKMGWFFLNELYDECVSSMRMRVPYDTGLLHSSIMRTPIKDGVESKSRAIYIRPFPYVSRSGEYRRDTIMAASYQEYGYRPHLVSPLLFSEVSKYNCDKKPGSPLYVTKYTPFIEKAIESTFANQDRIYAEFEEVWNRVTKGRTAEEHYGFQPFIIYDNQSGKFNESMQKTDKLTKHLWMKYGVVDRNDIRGVIRNRLLWRIKEMRKPGYRDKFREYIKDKIYIDVYRKTGRKLDRWGPRPNADAKIEYDKKRLREFYGGGAIKNKISKAPDYRNSNLYKNQRFKVG